MPFSFRKRSLLPVAAKAAFDWHARPGAFERLNPPWAPVQVLDKQGGLENGATVSVRVPVAPLLRLRAVFRHQNYQPGIQFEDVQASGPFASWKHTHRFQDISPSQSALEDDIEFELPGGRLAAGFAHKMLARIFSYRHRITTDDLALQHRYPHARPLRIAITGARGLVGSALVPFLETCGHEVIPFVRSRKPARSSAIYWDPVSGDIEKEKLEGLDAVIHLAGENITSGRWTDARKKLLWESRVQGTLLLSRTFSALSRPPSVFVSASAIGFFGERGEEVCSESSPAGKGFLPELAQAWEASALAAEKAGIRVVLPRISLVLAANGGALAKMLPAFKAGVAGRLGNGSQYMSWIELNDLLRLLYVFVCDTRYRGPVNCVAGAVTNQEFSKTLARILKRPALLPVPAPLLRLALGEMAQALLLSSTRVTSSELSKHHHQLSSLSLEDALRLQLGAYLE